MLTKPLAVVALLSTLVAAAGCSSARYYLQAIGGQMELVRKARPLQQVIADPATPAPLREKLERVEQMRDFASRELALPDNASYRRYADLQRPYVVWNVFATAEFSVMPREWCFPFAGCVGYKGYFARDAAENLARELRNAGDDVYLGGVPAYSTLGWLDDPILNTFIHYPDVEIARLIFHELAHQVAYAKGDTTFNESFAAAVEDAGMQRWLAAHATSQQRGEYERSQARKQAFVELVAKYRAQLQALYGQPLPPATMRARKRQTFDELRAEYGQLKKQWGGFCGFDAWFNKPLNNAQLASIAIYTQLVPAFQRILQDNAGDLPRFYQIVQRLAKAPKGERDAALRGATATSALTRH